MPHYIYQITNTVNGKTYIGAHSGAINDDYLGSGVLITSAIRKYGRSVFQKTILSEHSTPSEMFAAEARLVGDNFVAREDTYNLAPGGYGFKLGHKGNVGNQYALGHTWSLTNETKKKMSDSAKCHVGPRNNFYGKTHTPETRAKMSTKRGHRNFGTGRVLSVESKMKMRIAALARWARHNNEGSV